MNKHISLSIILAGLLTASTVQADEPDPKLHQQRVIEALKLNEQQAGEVRKIFEEVRPQLDALRQQRKEIHAKVRDRLKAVLTPEQLQKFDQMHEERKTHRRMRRQHSEP